MSNYETITVEKRGNVAILTINRPDKLNALNKMVHAEGVAALDELRRDGEVRVLVITGAGEKSFIAGADISEFEGQTPVTQRDLFHEETFFNSIDAFPKPVIAMVNGFCLGGGNELALACDRSYQLALPNDPAAAPTIEVGATNFGVYPMVTGQSRLARRFYNEVPALEAVRVKAGTPLDADAAFALGLITSNPDDIDWPDETRLAIEERVAMSPDALTGMEANLRFNGEENMFTRIFGRLTAWQNWIFQRPNAVGDKGALKVYGKGERAAFDFNRV